MSDHPRRRADDPPPERPFYPALLGKPGPKELTATLSLRLSFSITDPASASAEALMSRTHREVSGMVRLLSEEARLMGYQVEANIDYFGGRYA